jgi:hypothetical protein
MAVTTIPPSGLTDPIVGHNFLNNGDMSIHQRTGTISVDNANVITLDRWRVRDSAGGSVDVSQSTDVPSTSDVGATGSKFATSLYIDCTGATGSVGANDFAYMQQTIEAQFLQNLGWGESGAKSVTLSFWFKSNKTGQCSVQLFGEEEGRHYNSSYTVPDANWNYYTVTFPGDTHSDGQIDNNNGGGLTVRFNLTTGSNYQATAGSWTAGTKFGTSSDVNQLDDAANDLRWTGIKLEVGSLATPYQFRSFGQELQDCQRYYVKWTTASATGMGGVCRSTSAGIVGGLNFPVSMRAAPTMTWGTFTVIDSSASGVDATMSTNAAGVKGVTASFASASGLTDGNGAYLELKSGQTLQASAEL